MATHNAFHSVATFHSVAAALGIAALLLSGCASAAGSGEVETAENGEADPASYCETTSGGSVVCLSPEPGVVCLPLPDDLPIDPDLVRGCAYKTIAEPSFYSLFATTEDPDIEIARQAFLSDGETLSGEGASGPGAYQVSFVPKDGHQVTVIHIEAADSAYGSAEFYYRLSIG